MTGGRRPAAMPVWALRRRPRCRLAPFRSNEGAGAGRRASCLAGARRSAILQQLRGARAVCSVPTSFARAGIGGSEGAPAPLALVWAFWRLPARAAAGYRPAQCVGSPPVCRAAGGPPPLPRACLSAVFVCLRARGALPCVLGPRPGFGASAPIRICARPLSLGAGPAFLFCRWVAGGGASPGAGSLVLRVIDWRAAALYSQAPGPPCRTMAALLLLHPCRQGSSATEIPDDAIASAPLSPRKR
ncbi:unnamed protein product [Amoebophrya sp. A120]|nr:unnamed protein product [Amoebophrya sp. A120]|eukprot:GSA120T00000807001.1